MTSKYFMYALFAAIIPLSFTACNNDKASKQIDEIGPEITSPTESENIPNPQNSEEIEATKIIETAQIAGLNFSIKQQGNLCRLETEKDGIIVPDLGKNCQFHRLDDDEIQIVKGHHGPDFIVTSSVADENTDICSIRITTVTVSNEKTYFDTYDTKKAHCFAHGSLDAKYFLAPQFKGLPYPDED